MAVLEYRPLTNPTAFAWVSGSDKAELESGEYAAWVVPPEAKNVARVIVKIPVAGSWKLETGAAIQSEIDAGTQQLSDAFGVDQTAEADIELTPAGIIVVTCQAGEIVAYLEVK